MCDQTLSVPEPLEALEAACDAHWQATVGSPQEQADGIARLCVEASRAAGYPIAPTAPKSGSPSTPRLALQCLVDGVAHFRVVGLPVADDIADRYVAAGR